MKIKLILAGVVIMHAMPAFAHHSFAMFDAEKTLTLKGTVKVFNWTNPHTFLVMMVPTAEGPQQWSIEMGPPVLLAKQGWVPKSIKPGDKISATVHPLRDGTNGGRYLTVALPDGKIMGH